MSRVLLICLAALPFCLAAEGIAPEREKAVREEPFVATLVAPPEKPAVRIEPAPYECPEQGTNAPLAALATDVAVEHAREALDALDTACRAGDAASVLRILDTDCAEAQVQDKLNALETEIAGAALNELTQPQTLEDIGPVAANQLLEALKTKDYAAVNAVLALPKLTRWEAVGRFKVLSRLWAIQQRAIKKEKRGENTDAEWESFAETERLADSIAERMKAAKVERK